MSRVFDVYQMVDTAIAGLFLDMVDDGIMQKYRDTSSDQMLFAASTLTREQVRAQS